MLCDMAKFYNKSSYLKRKELWYAFLFIFCLAAVVALGKATSGNVQNNLGSVSFWYLGIIFLITILYNIGKIFEKKSDQYSSGIAGEQSVGKQLKKLSDEFTIFHNLKIQGVGDIDYVVIGPTGIFAVEVKSHRGRFSSQDEMTQRFSRQARYQAQQLRKFIQANFHENIWVDGILVFSRGRVQGGYQNVESLHIVEKGYLLGLIEGNKPRPGNLYKIQQKLIALFV
jgi:hypothetical protein